MVSSCNIRLPDELAELIVGLHPELKSRFKSARSMILNDPRCSNPLRERLKGWDFFRIKQMRIASGQIIEVVAADPHRNLYEETYLVISRGIDET